MGWSFTASHDFSPAHDLAAVYPQKVQELLGGLWWSEAERNRVLPLMAGLSVMFSILPPLPTTTRFNFLGDVQNVQRGMTPRIQGRSYAIEGELKVPAGGAEGVIVACAGLHRRLLAVGGRKGLLHHAYSLLSAQGVSGRCGPSPCRAGM